MHTEPPEKEKSKQGSQQKLKTHSNCHNRVQTEMSEQEKKKKQLMQYQCQALSYIDSQIKKNKKLRNPSNDLKKKTHQVNKSHDSSYYHLLKLRQEQPKSKR